MITVSGANMKYIVGSVSEQHLQLLPITFLLTYNTTGLEGMIPYEIADEAKVNLLTIRVQNNRLTQLVAPSICELDVMGGYYELVELNVDCEICPEDCTLCQERCS